MPVRTAYTAVTLSHLLLLFFHETKAAESTLKTLHPWCQDNCGGISIPYPFGIGADCFMSKSFNITCTTFDNGTQTPYLGGNIVMNLETSTAQARLATPISYQCYNKSMLEPIDGIIWSWDLSFTLYSYNNELNKFVVIGCDTLAYLNFSDGQNYYEGGCISRCSSQESLTNGSCSGIGCCQTAIPQGTNFISVSFDERYNNSEVYTFSPCSYALLTEEAEFKFNPADITGTTQQMLDKNLPVVVDWVVGDTTCESAKTDESSYACKSEFSECLNLRNGYICNCTDGYQGNPYLDGGCLDINECANQNPCPKPGKCHNTGGGYHCSCPFGWRKRTNNACEINLALILGIHSLFGYRAFLKF